MNPDITILDTHQHLIYAEKYPYSWTAEIPQLAGKAFRYDDYLKAIEGTGVSQTVFMESGVNDPHWREETRSVQELAAAPGSLIKGIIASCRPEAESRFEAYVESVLSPRLVGFRRLLHVEPDELSQSAAFAANLRLLSKHELTFDFCVLARQIPLASMLAGKCPPVQFILDHCGVPDIAARRDRPVAGVHQGNRQAPERGLQNIGCHGILRAVQGRFRCGSALCRTLSRAIRLGSRNMGQ